MNNKCIGCGVVLQSLDESEPGFVDHNVVVSNPFCKRCFKIKNYNEVLDYKEMDHDKYLKLYNNVISSENFVLYLCDILNIGESINKIKEIKGPKVLVVTKVDLLPKSVKEYKLFDYINDNYDLGGADIIFISSNKNYNIDALLSIIYKNKVSDKVYLVGDTNAGKSTLINAILKIKQVPREEITISHSPSTTQDLIKIRVDKDLYLIDTPGVVTTENITNYLSVKDIRNITPKKEIKPITYQIKPNQSLIIEDYARIDNLSETNNSFTLYLSNSIKIMRVNTLKTKLLEDLKESIINVHEKEDIVIEGLLFCKIVNPAIVRVYTIDKVGVYVRKSLI